jgi:hypothetical protein
VLPKGGKGGKGDMTGIETYADVLGLSYENGTTETQRAFFEPILTIDRP